MNVGLYRTTGAIESAERQLELVSTNLANVSTPGFKRHLGSVQSQLVGTAASGELGVTTRERIDFSQGVLERTGNPLDLALEGDGFLEVEGPNGPLYTRNGKLRLDPQGNLVTAEGYAVAWEGRGGVIDPAGDAPLVSTDGSVSQAGQLIGRLSRVSFPAQDQLGLTRDGYFVAAPELLRTASSALIHQGALEGSNANGVSELVSMVTVQRSHEMAANILRQVDQSYRRLHQGR
jgi:flagellar basal-body rod protein FlgF